MFQTGIIRPIEEIDGTCDQVEPSDGCRVDVHNHFLRAFPGSPPLSALRNHRVHAVQQLESEGPSGGPTPHDTTQISCSALPGLQNGIVPTALCATPPARPPKPRNLTLDSSVSPKPPPTLPKLNTLAEPKNSIAANSHYANGQEDSISNKSPNLCAASVNDATELRNQALCDHPIDTAVPSVHVFAPKIASPNSAIAPLVFTVNTPDTLLASNQPASPVSSVVSDEPAYRSLEDCNNGARLSSWQRSTTLDRISPTVDEVPCYQDFILRPEAFCKSPQFTSEETSTSGHLPELQHAVPFAVGSLDEEDSEGVGAGHTHTSLPIPASLKVLAIDSSGVHILEDGNFFYAVEGLSSHPESPVDSSFLNLSPRGSVLTSVTDDHSAEIENPTADDIPGSNATSKHSIADSSSDSLGKRVRFSTEPIVVYSTHSTSEYNRRNEDINPLAASAEYELEKQLEDMELFNVELFKSPTGLGISILGLGVDNVGGDQKLGIFIKSLTPGGAAEANGRIHVFDQIVEVDGINLVGVSQQFAAQTLRNTREVVHFVLARERNPNNSRVAQLLAEQEEEDERQSRSLESWRAFQSPKNPIHDLNGHHITFPFDGSTRPLTDVEQTVVSSVDSSSDIDDSAEGEDGLAKYSVSDKVDDESTGLLFTANPIFTSYAESLALCTVSDHAAFHVPHNQDGSMDSSKPPSVLKGTATAASTKRHQDAVLRLIRMAQQRVEADVTDSEQSSVLNPTDPGVDRIAWILASDLRDCQTQLMKLQSRVQQLEQRLTAQEAAADEAIERLCLQRQHVMQELKESRERLKKYINTQNSHYSSNGVPPSGSPLLNGRTSTANSSALLDDSRTKSYHDFSAPSTTSSVEASASDSDSAVTQTRFSQVALSENQPTAIPSLPLLTVSSSNASPAFAPRIPKFTHADTSRSHSCSSNQLSYLKHAYHRVRLVASGGLARRRPPTRFMIASAPGLFLGTPHLFNERHVLHAASPAPSLTSTSFVSDHSSPSAADDCPKQDLPSASPGRRISRI